VARLDARASAGLRSSDVGQSRRADDPIVFVVDDDQGVREATKNLIESVGLRVLTFATAQEFLTSERPDAPGCLVLDVRLPGLSGLDLQRELGKTSNPVPIIFVTGHGDIPMTVEAMKAGAMEFLTKPFRDQELLDAIARGIERDRVERKQRGELLDLRRRHDSLTPREREVMGLVVKGLLNKQVGAELGMSETTVKFHRGQLMQKMKAQSLADLVRIAERLQDPTSQHRST
jgi:FixJ family two-component response regulator